VECGTARRQSAAGNWINNKVIPDERKLYALKM
jgi:hypothetical protein